MLPSGIKDPDELARQNGRAGIDVVLQNRKPAASAYLAARLSTARSEADLHAVALQAIPFLSAVGVCHPVEAGAATELLAHRGIDRAALRLLTKQLALKDLHQVRDSLVRKLAEIDSLLSEMAR
jgi:DNA primase